ncbi:MAG: aminotransferase class I/II-fold pyridoxal phosphate-dependent enzyme [Pirellulales bacterium]
MNDPQQHRTIDDVCSQPAVQEAKSLGLASPIYPSSVYHCSTTDEADALLAGTLAGYISGREGHPNASALARRCADLHGCDEAQVCGSGMAAIALALLAEVSAGDHVVISDQLYGRTTQLVSLQLARLGVTSTAVDATDPTAVAAALRENTRVVLVETISNPLLRVVDVRSLAELAHARGAVLVVDNTLACPAVCRPADFGADIVVESLTKLVNGHSDVLLGVVCTNTESPAGCQRWSRIKSLAAIWGFTASPFECWLAHRGSSTLALRADRSCDNAGTVARWLDARRTDSASGISEVIYPGLATHADHAVAQAQFTRHAGYLVTFTLSGGRASVDRFIAAGSGIPFCPSFGDLTTTLSHPESTSHRGYSPAEREALGIAPGMIRLSVGIESPDTIVARLAEALAAAR